MRLVNSIYGLDINIIENEVNIIVVEDPHSMADIMCNLRKQLEGEEGKFILSDSDSILKLEKNIILVDNPFTVSLNEKKILSKLYEHMKQGALELMPELSEINKNIMEYLDKILEMLPFNDVVYNLDIEVEGLFKLYGIKIGYDYDNILDRLLEYIKAVSLLLGYKIIAFLNIKSFLDKEELVKLYEMSNYFKINLLLIETREGEQIAGEKIYIIDKDKCLIVK